MRNGSLHLLGDTQAPLLVRQGRQRLDQLLEEQVAGREQEQQQHEHQKHLGEGQRHGTGSLAEIALFPHDQGTGARFGRGLGHTRRVRGCILQSAYIAPLSSAT